MSYINESQLSNYRSLIKSFSSESFNILNEDKNRDISKPMVFLSHKHDETQILHDVVAFLKAEGVDIYVDWMDDKMPAYTSSTSALELKKKIELANKFILIATPDAINSKWCNWELGIGDVYKYKEHIAIFPINKTDKRFIGSEYLRIYSSIVEEDGTNVFKNGSPVKAGFYVRTPASERIDTIMSLKDWLKQ